MEYGNEKYTDEELKQALIKANGQPTKAAEILDVDYSGVYRRIRKNPELLEVQKAYRARTFQVISNMSVNALIQGIIQEPETDEDGNIIEGKFRKIKVPLANRLALIPSVMQTFKFDEGITDKLDITTNGNDISSGLKIEIIDKREDVKIDTE